MEGYKLRSHWNIEYSNLLLVYISQNKSISFIAKKFNMHPETVKRKLRKLNLYDENWDIKKDQLLIKLVKEKKTNAEIAKILKKSKSSVGRRRIKLLGKNRKELNPTNVA